MITLTTEFENILSVLDNSEFYVHKLTGDQWLYMHKLGWRNMSTGENSTFFDGVNDDVNNLICFGSGNKILGTLLGKVGNRIKHEKKS